MVDNRQVPYTRPLDDLYSLKCNAGLLISTSASLLVKSKGAFPCSVIFISNARLDKTVDEMLFCKLVGGRSQELRLSYEIYRIIISISLLYL